MVQLDLSNADAPRFDGASVAGRFALLRARQVRHAHPSSHFLATAFTALASSRGLEVSKQLSSIS
jgi:hypothetical protein